MSRIVMKFGGTSMAGIERIRHVADRVKREVQAGNEVAVVSEGAATPRPQYDRIVAVRQPREQHLPDAAPHRRLDLGKAIGRHDAGKGRSRGEE